MTALVVAALVLAAVLLGQGPAAGSRLRRLAAPSPRADDVRPAPAVRAFAVRLPRPSREPPADTAQSVSELAALLRAGVPARRAWEHAARSAAADGPWAAVLRQAAAAAGSGGDVSVALRAGATSCRAGERRAAFDLAAAWRVAELTGAPTAGVLVRLAEALRRDEDARGARDAALAGPRATARLLTWLPAGGLLIGQAIGADPLAVLAGTTAGRVCAVTGAVLAVTGTVWTRRLVRSAEAGS